MKTDIIIATNRQNQLNPNIKSNFRNEYHLPDKVYEYLWIEKKWAMRDDIDEIILDYISSKHLPRTQIEYANDIKQFKEFYDIKHNYEFLLLKHTHAKKYMIYLENNCNKLSPSIIKRRLSVLNQMFEYMKDYAEQITNENDKVKLLKNPFKLIKWPKVQQDSLKTSALTEKELNDLITVIIPEKDTELEIQTKQRDKLLILLHVQTWVRVDELLQAKLMSFSIHKEEYVSYWYKSKWWKIKESLIEFRLFNLIQAFCDRYWIGKNDYIFHPLSQNPLNYRKDKSISQVYYRKILKEYWAKAWISKHLKTHSLRATFITLLHTKGMDIQQIKDAVGHNSIAMTSLYIKSHMDSKESANKIMKGLLEY